MFDDKEPVDIFAEVDKPAPPKPTTSGVAPGTAPIQGGSRRGSPLLLIVVILMVLAGLGGGGYWLYSSGRLPFLAVVNQNMPLQSVDLANDVATNEIAVNTPEPAAPQPPAQTPPVNEAPPAAPEPTPPVNEQPAIQLPLPPDVAAKLPDADKDGLPDVEETRLVTDPNNADTDADGLADGDEVNVFATDPLKPDSDGDTYPDGQEAKGGYNPTGSDKMTEEEKQKYAAADKQSGLHEPTMTTIGRTQAVP